MWRGDCACFAPRAVRCSEWGARALRCASLWRRAKRLATGRPLTVPSASPGAPHADAHRNGRAGASHDKQTRRGRWEGMDNRVGRMDDAGTMN